MIGYNPSHLNTNETLLEAFHRVEAYLKANPQYQVYQSSATYQEGTQEYALDTIVVPEGSTVGKGDVVLFSNVYYAVITAVSETTFSVETATNFRGAQGEQGPKGDTGATGGKGETGSPALTYSKSVTLAASQSSFITELDGYNRPPQINDICLYVSPNTSQIINGIIEEIRPDTQQVTVRRKSTIYARGEKGEPGGQGANGKDGNATLLYAGELSESITTAEITQVTRPQNRGILVKDILISTAASTFGAMAQVTALPVGVTTVDVSFIGTLESGGGSGVSDYNELANIPVINQDLSASGFTPTANTYYRHTGATTDTFTQGVIYYYNSTGYVALDGSDPGLATVAKTGSYNDLSNIPVINQDLSASGFTPVANTYYRHTGTTTDTFTQGVIYLYDTAYHKLGESGGGGGTTLNLYETTFENIKLSSSMSHLNRILKNAKGRTQVRDYNGFRYLFNWVSDNVVNLGIIKQQSNSIRFEKVDLRATTGTIANNFFITITGTDVTYGNVDQFGTLIVRYFNDTEIL